MATYPLVERSPRTDPAPGSGPSPPRAIPSDPPQRARPRAEPRTTRPRASVADARRRDPRATARSPDAAREASSGIDPEGSGSSRRIRPHRPGHGSPRPSHRQRRPPLHAGQWGGHWTALLIGVVVQDPIAGDGPSGVLEPGSFQNTPNRRSQCDRDAGRGEDASRTTTSSGHSDARCCEAASVEVSSSRYKTPASSS